MNSLVKLVKKDRMLSNERGQGMAEYAIMVILVAIIVLVSVRLFGESVFDQFENAQNEIETLQGP